MPPYHSLLPTSFSSSSFYQSTPPLLLSICLSFFLYHLSFQPLISCCQHGLSLSVPHVLCLIYTLASFYESLTLPLLSETFSLSVTLPVSPTFVSLSPDLPDHSVCLVPQELLPLCFGQAHRTSGSSHRTKAGTPWFDCGWRESFSTSWYKQCGPTRTT